MHRQHSQWTGVLLSTLTWVASGFAQLKPGSMTPAGGEAYHVGQEVSVKWTQEKGNDGKYDLYFSKNGGTRFSEFEANWQGPTTDNTEVTYKWKVPAGSETENGVLRVCQMAGGHCSDRNYVLDSEAFAVTTNAVAIAPKSVTKNGILLQGSKGALSASFKLNQAGRVTLKALNLEGREIATLIDQQASAGDFQFDLFSRALQGQKGPLFFNLSLDNQLLGTSVQKF
jgi:hypothetical protein